MGALRQLGGLTSDLPESDGQAKAEAHVGAGKRKAEQQGGRGSRVRRAHDVPLDDKGRYVHRIVGSCRPVATEPRAASSQWQYHGKNILKEHG